MISKICGFQTFRRPRQDSRVLALPQAIGGNVETEFVSAKMLVTQVMRIWFVYKIEHCTY